MKKRKKRGLFLCLFLAVAALWGWQVVRVNRQYPDVTRETYPLGQMVDLEDDVVYYDDMEGYSVRLNWAAVWEYQDLLDAYELGTVDEPFGAPERLYLLDITLVNTDNAEGGILLGDWYIQSLYETYDLDSAVFYAINQLDTEDVALRPNSEMEFLIPYSLRESRFPKKPGISWKNTPCG